MVEHRICKETCVHFKSDCKCILARTADPIAERKQRRVIRFEAVTNFLKGAAAIGSLSKCAAIAAASRQGVIKTPVRVTGVSL